MAVDAPDMKRRARVRIRGARAARAPAQLELDARSLAEMVRRVIPDEAADIACYASLAAEPGTGPMRSALEALGHRVWLPRIDGTRLAWLRDGRTRIGAFGIAEPEGPESAELADMDVVLVPALAVDRSGARLGRGGGYYDRALADVPAHRDGGPLLVAVVNDDEVLDEVPAEPHDRRVDMILTPARTLSTRA